MLYHVSFHVTLASKQHEHMDAPTILLHLKELFEEQNRTERYEISKALFRCRMVEGTSAMQHGLKMNGYIERLASLGFVMDAELSIDFNFAEFA